MGRCRETLRRKTGVGAYHRRTGTPNRVRLKKLDGQLLTSSALASLSPRADDVGHLM
jgi:hypothetical protein